MTMCVSRSAHVRIHRQLTWNGHIGADLQDMDCGLSRNDSTGSAFDKEGTQLPDNRGLCHETTTGRFSRFSSDVAYSEVRTENHNTNISSSSERNAQNGTAVCLEMRWQSK